MTNDRLAELEQWRGARLIGQSHYGLGACALCGLARGRAGTRIDLVEIIDLIGESAVTLVPWGGLGHNSCRRD